MSKPGRCQISVMPGERVAPAGEYVAWADDRRGRPLDGPGHAIVVDERGERIVHADVERAPGRADQGRAHLSDAVQQSRTKLVVIEREVDRPRSSVAPPRIGSSAGWKTNATRPTRRARWRARSLGDADDDGCVGVVSARVITIRDPRSVRAARSVPHWETVDVRAHEQRRTGPRAVQHGQDARAADALHGLESQRAHAAGQRRRRPHLLERQLWELMQLLAEANHSRREVPDVRGDGGHERACA
jgi:hypothetical protein